jgi:hypothetical protein
MSTPPIDATQSTLQVAQVRTDGVGAYLDSPDKVSPTFGIHREIVGIDEASDATFVERMQTLAEAPGDLGATVVTEISSVPPAADLIRTDDYDQGHSHPHVAEAEPEAPVAAAEPVEAPAETIEDSIEITEADVAPAPSFDLSSILVPAVEMAPVETVTPAPEAPAEDAVKVEAEAADTPSADAPADLATQLGIAPDSDAPSV